MPYIQLQFRRDTSCNWQQMNPLLASGEMGVELDTHTFKIGDGCLRWNDLPYGGLRGPPGPPGPAGNIPNPSHGTTRAVIKVSQNGTNFDFTNAITNIPLKFGSNYLPGIYVNNLISGTGTDTTGFSINMNLMYNMLNLPIIMGTVAYWDGQKINYMQIKFGNSSTSNAVRATIVPGNISGRDPVTNNPTYGSPLQLRVDGISSNAFVGVSNISLNTPLQYALMIYLELMN